MQKSRALPLSGRFAAALLLFLALAPTGRAQLFGPRRAAPVAPAQQAPAGEFLRRQEEPKFTSRLLDSTNEGNSRVVVKLGAQRVFLLNTASDEVVIDSPISSGKRGHSTPKGDYRIMQKDKDHRSSIYGDFVDRSNRVVRRGVSTKIDSAPAGSRYVGAPMRWFMRLRGDGVGMHTGILPGYPASHGCIRLPDQVAMMIFQRVKVGTPVLVTD